MIADTTPARTFTCTPVAVYDADGPIWCKEGPRLRIAGAAARETDGTCRPGHPCPAMPPEQARAVTIRMMGARVTGRLRTGHLTVTAPPMLCTWRGTSGKRTVASRLAGGRDLGCAIIRAGAAADWPVWRERYGMEGCRG